MTRFFYSCSVGQPGKGYDEDNLKRIISNVAFILHEDTARKGGYSQIKAGDILVLKYREKFIAFGEALEIQTSHEEEWNLFAPVKEWHFKNIKDFSDGIGIYGIGDHTDGGGQFDTVKKIERGFALQKINAIDKTNNLYQALIKEHNMDNELEEVQKYIDLLKYKKQIILQGPPGTGKTRLAKLMASEMIKSGIKMTPLEYLKWYVEHFQASSLSRGLAMQQSSLLREFYNAFPVEDIGELTLDDYCRGKGSITSFCYWIENKLGTLGQFSPGQAGSDVYGVYYNAASQSYKCKIGTPEQMLFKIKSSLELLLKNKDYTSAREIFRYSLILKILNSYFPDEYFPVFSQRHLKFIARILGIYPGDLDDVQLNKQINEHFNQIKHSAGSEISSYEFMRHLYDKFNIKNDGLIPAEVEVVDSIGESRLIQFHPSFTYEDFVRGINAVANENGQVEYKVENKILAILAERALANPAINYVLIIDEINRANLSSVLGELIYAFEYRGKPVTSMYTLDESNILILPDNLFIIGTMNTADRSVSYIDYAIRRRFAFVDVKPKNLGSESGADFNESLYHKVAGLFIKPHLSPEFEAKDVQLGHSYFMIHYRKDIDGKDIKSEPYDFNLRVKFEILPILKEYFKDGILTESASTIIEEIENTTRTTNLS